LHPVAALRTTGSKVQRSRMRPVAPFGPWSPPPLVVDQANAGSTEGWPSNGKAWFFNAKPEHVMGKSASTWEQFSVGKRPAPLTAREPAGVKPACEPARELEGPIAGQKFNLRNKAPNPIWHCIYLM
jgi:hypothetical protein